jgi:hypothetical protein
MAVFSFAQGQLSSNFVYIVAPGAVPGEIRAVGDSTVNTIAIGPKGETQSIVQTKFPRSGESIARTDWNNSWKIDENKNLYLPWYNSKYSLLGYVIFDEQKSYTPHLDTSLISSFFRTDSLLELYQKKYAADSLFAQGLTSATEFTLANGSVGIAFSSFGGGLAYSVDGGANWKFVANRAEVKGDLGSVRIVPSVLRGDAATALVAYRVSQNSQITIEVFSYDMKKLRTIVKDAPRDSDPIRSSHRTEDTWDGKDKHGKAVAAGVYYIKVSDNHGHTGWGKAMVLGGNR